jgi:hypothetical protein
MAIDYKSVLVSAMVSVTCSLVVTVVGYNLLVPSVREAQIRAGSLFADGIYSIQTVDGVETDYCTVSVENHGPLALNNVAVTLRISPGTYKDANVEITPPRGQPERTQDGLIVRLGTLAPADHVSVKLAVSVPSSPPVMLALNGHSPSVLSNFTEWISADGSPTMPVSWRYGGSSATASFTIKMKAAPKKQTPQKGGH